MDEHSTPGVFIDLTGARFSRLFIVRRAQRPVEGTARARTCWEARCDCGQTVVVLAQSLQNGRTKSCGCLGKEMARHAAVVHGACRGAGTTPEYRAWRSMIARCIHSRNVAYARYGGRGIRVCDRWRESFENFLADMGQKPSPKHSVDRIDNNGNYEPGNCRWATLKEQTRNTRGNRVIAHCGLTMCLSDWATYAGMSRMMLSNRLRRGWTIAEALSTPRVTSSSLASQ